MKRGFGWAGTFQDLLTCMGSCVPFQVESVVETFATECAQISLDVGVAFEMSIKQTRQIKPFLANWTFHGIVGVGLNGGSNLGLVAAS